MPTGHGFRCGESGDRTGFRAIADRRPPGPTWTPSSRARARHGRLACRPRGAQCGHDRGGRRRGGRRRRAGDVAHPGTGQAAGGVSRGGIARGGTAALFRRAGAADRADQGRPAGAQSSSAGVRSVRSPRSCHGTFPSSWRRRRFAPALAAGNTVVLKPSPYTPLATALLGSVLGSVLPPGASQGGHRPRTPGRPPRRPPGYRPCDLHRFDRHRPDRRCAGGTRAQTGHPGIGRQRRRDHARRRRCRADRRPAVLVGIPQLWTGLHGGQEGLRPRPAVRRCGRRTRAARARGGRRRRPGRDDADRPDQQCAPARAGRAPGRGCVVPRERGSLRAATARPGPAISSPRRSSPMCPATAPW